MQSNSEDRSGTDGKNLEEGIERAAVGVYLFLQGKIMSVFSDLKAAGVRAGGSHLTREYRERTANNFSEYLKANNIQIKDATNIREKHIIGYLAQREVCARQRQNELSHLRVALREAGREDFADRLGTQRMGVEKATRDGTHRAINTEEYKAVREAALLKDAGVAAAIAMAREFGLRSKEATMLQLDTLHRFEKELARGGTINVLEGTKGGRGRWTNPVDKERAQNAIKEAIAAASASKKGFLVEGKNGDLKSALYKFHRITRECGMSGKISPHSLRYAYACERIDQKRDEGLSRREALIQVSRDLGHGDGRGTYIEQVYSRR